MQDHSSPDKPIRLFLAQQWTAFRSRMRHLTGCYIWPKINQSIPETFFTTPPDTDVSQRCPYTSRAAGFPKLPLPVCISSGSHRWARGPRAWRRSSRGPCARGCQPWWLQWARERSQWPSAGRHRWPGEGRAALSITQSISALPAAVKHPLQSPWSGVIAWY